MKKSVLFAAGIIALATTAFANTPSTGDTGGSWFKACKQGEQGCENGFKACKQGEQGCAQGNTDCTPGTPGCVQGDTAGASYASETQEKTTPKH